MINLMIANRQENSRYNNKNIELLIKAQIENSLDFWKPEDIIILSNFDFEYMGVKLRKIELNDFCLTGSKIFGIMWLFDNTDCDVVWAHDLDAWQDAQFDCPECKDIGITKYYNRNYNGGSVFWKRKSYDIVKDIVTELKTNKEHREEPTLNKLLKTSYKKRITTIDGTFNVGCTNFASRYFNSLKPVRVHHFHPYNRIAWETHVLDRSGIGEGTISVRLERILRKYYINLPIKLKGDISEKTRKRVEKCMQSMQKKSSSPVSNPT